MIVLNLDDSQVTLEALRQVLLENPIAALKEIIVIKGGKIILFYPCAYAPGRELEMALEYTLELSTKSTPTQAMDALTSNIKGLTWGKDRFVLFDPTSTICTTNSLEITQKVIGHGAFAGARTRRSSPLQWGNHRPATAR